MSLKPNMSLITTPLWVGGSIANDEQMATISDMGFTAILNLEVKDDAPLLDGYVELLHMDYLHLPVEDSTAKWKPTFVKQGLDFFHNAMSIKPVKNEIGFIEPKVYVHCSSGISRSTSMAYGILRSQGLTAEEAKARILRARPQAQLDYIKDVEAALKRYPKRWNIGQ